MRKRKKSIKDGCNLTLFKNIIKSTAKNASKLLGEMVLICDNSEMDSKIQEIDKHLSFIERMCEPHPHGKTIPFPYPNGHAEEGGDKRA